MIKRIAAPVLALGLGAALFVGTAVGAGAAPLTGKGVPAPVAGSPATSGKVPSAAPAATLTNYKQVHSAQLVDAANSQSSGTVTCPRGFKAVGGGAIITSTSLAETLNASIPSTSNPRLWQVWVNNTSGTDGTFVVYATCAEGLLGYTVVASGGYADPPGLNEATQPAVSCPRGKVLLGGGGYTTSSSNLVNLAGSTPTSTGRTWYAAYYNTSSGSTTDYAYAVCAHKPDGYSVVGAAGVTVAPGSQGGATATCPSGSVVLGGGGSPAVFYDQSISLNSTGPVSSTTWEAWLNNGFTTSATLYPAAICATFA